MYIKVRRIGGWIHKKTAENMNRVEIGKKRR